MSRPRVTVARRPFIPAVLTFLYPFVQPAIFMWVADKRGPNIPYPPKKVSAPQATLPPLSTQEMENTFIDVLVKACSHRHQARTTPTRKTTMNPHTTYHKTRRRYFQSSARQCGDALRPVVHAQARPARAVVSKDDYIKMLDYYRESYHLLASPTTSESPRFDTPIVRFDEADKTTEESIQPRIQRVPSRQTHHSARDQPVVEKSMLVEHNGSKALSEDESGEESVLTASQTQSMGSRPEDPLLNSPTVEQKWSIDSLQVLLEDETSSHDQIYEAYCQLPSPGVKYLSDSYRLLLLRRLSIIEVKNRKAMLRYLNLVDDMKEASLPLNQAEWTSAIAYVGRCYWHVDASNVEDALHIWKEMEQDAGVRSTGVTFNVLFDIATKAGKYVLAEMILKEMQARGFEYTRFSYVGFIFYYGMKGDGAGVRRAYKEFVEAGQIVDTVVMNCVIASLIRAGELPAAEQVYERMKRLLYEKTDQPVPKSDWRYSRDLGRILDKATRAARGNQQRLHRLQAEQFLVPNLRTFCIFIDHHVHATGELRHITALLGEMQSLQIPMHGRVFVKIFQGFWRHGGVKYTSWTRQRLEAVWDSLLVALDQELEDVHMVKWMVVWVVRAFAKCSGRERTLEVWEQVRDRWKISGADEKGTVEYLVRDALEGYRKEDGL